MNLIQYLDENRIEFLKDKYKDLETTHDSLGKLKGADVVDHFSDKADPTKNKVHTDWIMRQYKSGKVRQEDHPKIHSTLSDFEKYKPKLANKDLNSYKSVKDVSDATKEHLNKPVTNREKDAHVVQSGLEKLHDTGDKQIYHLKTKEASQKVYGGGASRGGTGTDWCTAARSDDCMFNAYHKEGKLHTIHIKNDPDSPYQHHSNTGQFMDRHDNEVHAGEFIEKHKDLAPHMSTWHPDFAMKSSDLDNHVNAPNTHDGNEIKGAVLRNPKCTPEHVKSIMNTPSGFYVHEKAAAHPQADKETIDVAMKHPSSYVRMSAVLNKNATNDHLKMGLTDNAGVVREATKNKIAHMKTIPTALKDNNKYIRAAALEHPKAEDSHIKRALKDPSSYVRKTAMQVAKDRGIQEEAPVNAVGGGAVASLGVGPSGEPPMNKKKQVKPLKRFKDFVKCSQD